MKRLLLLCLFLKACICFGQAKTQTIDTLDLSDLYTPAAPGFVLMNKAPTAVDKPTTTKAFEADLLNLAQGAAIQVTPFWFKDHPMLTDDKYTTHWHPVYETMNLSLATVKSDTNYSIALGFRSQLLRIFSLGGKNSLDKKLDSMHTMLATCGYDLVALKDTVQYKKDTAALNKIFQRYTKLITRPLFTLEVAGAALAQTPNLPYSKSSLGKLNTSGAWANLKYIPLKLPIDFVGVIRYTWSGLPPKVSTRDSAFVDVGIGIFYSGRNISFSGEYLNRYDRSLNKNYDRLAVAANYKISNQFVVIASFGKNFANVENLFTSLGINFGLSKNTGQVATPPVPN